MTSPRELDRRMIAAVSFYASFDEDVQADFGAGKRTPDTRFGPPPEPDKHVFTSGFDSNLYRIARGCEISGGALEATGLLPDNGRIFFPVKGNLAFDRTGWSGAVSFWANTDPNESIKAPFCDPLQITQNGANNGGLWVDFNKATPRDLRHGAFPAAVAGQSPISEDAPDAPLVRVPRVGWKAGEWHHVVLNWRNLDTGRPDAVSALWIDGHKIGEIGPREIAMKWNPDRAGIYVAVNYVGLLDELALFSRALMDFEIERLHAEPSLLATSGLKTQAAAQQ